MTELLSFSGLRKNAVFISESSFYLNKRFDKKYKYLYKY